MIIFGWGHQKRKNHGPAFEKVCQRCGNQAYWHLLEISEWFTLFFIPIFPYKNDRYLLCPVCSNGLKILREDGFLQLKNIAETNRLYLNNRITLAEYNNRIAIHHSNYINEAKKVPMLGPIK